MMRHNLSIPRLAIVVAWAALAPQSRWSELFPTAVSPDSGPLPQGDAGNWHGWVLGYGSASATENYLRGRAALAQAEAEYQQFSMLDGQTPDAASQSLADRPPVLENYFALTGTDTTYPPTARSPRRSPDTLAQIAER